MENHSNSQLSPKTISPLNLILQAVIPFHTKNEKKHRTSGSSDFCPLFHQKKKKEEKKKKDEEEEEKEEGQRSRPKVPLEESGRKQVPLSGRSLLWEQPSVKWGGGGVQMAVRKRPQTFDSTQQHDSSGRGVGMCGVSARKLAPCERRAAE